MRSDPAPETRETTDRDRTDEQPGAPESLTWLMPPERPSLADREQLYINRELGMLRFQERVFEEAVNPDNPLLDRVKFLAILGSNLDEFFMVRVGGLIMQQRAGIVDFSIDGKPPAEQLAAIRKSAVSLMQRAVELFRDQFRPALEQAGIHVLDYGDLTSKQTKQMEPYFHRSIFPVLTPQAFDPGHPFPHISNLSLNLAVLIRDPRGEEHFARIKVPSTLPRLLPIKRSSGGTRKDGTVPHHHYFVWIEQVIAAHLGALFPGMEVLEVHPFRVTRNADIEIQELEASDLLETMTESVQERRFGPVVRLELDREMSADCRALLVENLNVHANDRYDLSAPLGLSGLWQLCDIDRYDLKEPPYTPVVPKALRPEKREGSIFAAIRQNDYLLHHPYEAFDPVIEFLKEATRDPDVLAIKQTLYRVGAKSPVVKYLLEARREHRKQVTVLVELKARFDEESNIGWAKMLESEGVHVIYGLLGLKTHAKVLLVVRREGDDLRRYLHLGTGNYNHVTARIYEDVGMFTCDPELGADATDLFNYLTGYSAIGDFRKLLVAPLNLRRRFDELIQREIDHHRAGRESRLIFKCNSIVDEKLINRLYSASQAGVEIDLIVRGICSLRPGLPGVSDNIRVRSIVGRFLEHSRIYYFRNGGEDEIYLGSADLMTRNIDRRVETVFPVGAPELVRRLRDTVLATYLADNVKARIMHADGTYAAVMRADGEPPIDAQEHLMKNAARG
jgi:polyphosphate kinase